MWAVVNGKRVWLTRGTAHKVHDDALTKAVAAENGIEPPPAPTLALTIPDANPDIELDLEADEEGGLAN